LPINFQQQKIKSKTFGQINFKGEFMKKIFLFVFMILGFTTSYAHTLLLDVVDNKNNTITVIGKFSTGDKAEDAMVRLESLSTAQVLYKKRLPSQSELTIQIPKEPYQIVLDGGPESVIVQKGIAPLEGFTKNIKTKKDVDAKLTKSQQTIDSWTLTTIIFFILCLTLLILTLVFSYKNTNKILHMIKINHL